MQKKIRHEVPATWLSFTDGFVASGVVKGLVEFVHCGVRPTEALKHWKKLQKKTVELKKRIYDVI